MGCYYPFAFDSAIISADGEYAFIYKKLGTKGLLLKNGELVREINRSYYCAASYEYPAAFITFQNKTYLVHCPMAYNQLDFEDVETGELITKIQGRQPDDHFYSRLEVSPDGMYLISKGWVWHPLHMVLVFNIPECMTNPHLLDKSQICPNFGIEICTASFVDNDTIVLGASEEVYDEETPQLPIKHIALWNFKTNELSNPVKPTVDIGNLYAINHNYVWDLYGFPKIINLNTGEVVESKIEIDSGKQQSSMTSDRFPSIVFNSKTKHIAIKGKELIEVLSPEIVF